MKNNLLKDKRGLVTLGVIIFVFMIFLWVLFIGIYATIFSLIYNNLNIDLAVGQVNLGTITQSTFGQIATAFLSKADILGYALIFGMVLNMFASAYFFRGKYPKLFIIIDIMILVFAYIVAVYVSGAYEFVINSTTELSVFIDNMARSSTFLLRLPLWVSIIGVIIMILSYAGFPRETGEEIAIGQIN